TGHRTLTIHTTTDHTTWTHHATATLTPHPTVEPAAPAWSDADTEALAPVDGLYERLADVGFHYGPAFQGLRAVGRRGGDLLAEVRLPEELRADAGRFDIHPALLDAALHACLLEGSEGVRLPFVWSGITLHATGADVLRVRLSPVGADTVSLTACDEAGQPVVSIASLTLRPVTPEQFRAVVGVQRHSPLYEVRWLPLPFRGGDGAPSPVLVGPALPGLPAPAYEDLGKLFADPEITDGGTVPAVVAVSCAGGAGGDPVADAHTALGRALELLKSWLTQERFASSRLVLLTRGAVAVRDGEDVTDLAWSPLWGLMRSAQSEHPGRLVVADVDAAPESYLALTAALGDTDTVEPQLAVRAGKVFAARLGEVEPVEAPSGEVSGNGVFDGTGTVLITGGTGLLGGLFARHLVERHGVRHLLLLSRRGPDAPDAHRLRTELQALGATVTITACDTSDRTALQQTLHHIPHDHPLTAVIHTAGTLNDATLDTLTPHHITTVMQPKADTAWHLHQLTREHGLKAFVLFSSAAGVLGQAGQAGYSAANAFLDALARHRRAAGLPAVSLAWGLWEESGGMTGHLTETDLLRLRRTGLAPMTCEDGLALFDAALRAVSARADRAVLVPARLDMASLRAGAGTPALLSGLVRPAVRRAAVGGSEAPERDADGAALRNRIGKLAPAERDRALLDLVRLHVATVLGHAEPQRVEPSRGFLELGVDSLTALELRNRLGAEAGLRLPATLIFNHPTSAAVARYLADELFPAPRQQEGSEDPAAASGGGVETDGIDEAAFRRALATIPFTRFRTAGLVDVLLHLADGRQEPTGPESDVGPGEARTPTEAGEEIGSAIDSMDLDGLIRAALGDN
ncbi:type I polyketide synthase, partial [Streptomyces sp. NPDC015220]|uniref:type I polyketide synthase n=1 Tax=Streptomyces sp. NPDC015220 TaxID=3364947 RepID=UPI0036FC83E8